MVQLAESVIATSDQRQYLAGVRIHGNECHLRLRAWFDLSLVFSLGDFYALRATLRDLVIHQLDSALYCLSGRTLKITIQRGVNPISLLVHFTLRHLAAQRVANQIHEVRSVAGFDVRSRQLQRRSLGFLGLLLCDRMGLGHAVKNQIAALSCTFRMAIRRESAGALNDACQERGLGKAEIFQVLVEVSA